MSCNNFPFNYYYNRNQCHNPCQQSQCHNPCQQQLQQLQCHDPCRQQIQCPNPCNPCPAVSYITTIPTPTPNIPSGLPAPTGTVTPIIGFSPTPSTNIGGITLNGTNGQFTIPVTGRYVITAFVGFVETPTTVAGGTRQLYIYKVDGTTGALTLLAEDSRNAVITGNTYISIATTADLNPGDRVFIAATQSNTAGTPINTTTDGRFTITRLC
jgi:hypothetical protein